MQNIQSAMSSLANILVLLSFVSCITADNYVNKTVTACKKEMKIKDPCFPLCMAKKLNYTTANGDLIVKNLPFVDWINKFDLVNKCINKMKNEAKCEKLQKIGKCFKDEMVPVLKNITLQCVAETNTTLPSNSSSKQNMTILFTDKFACFDRCILKKVDLIDAKNDLLLSKVYKNVYFFKPAELDAVVKGCAGKNTQPDQCKQALHKMLCVNQAMNEKFKNLMKQ